jgi:hypothetical protein
VVFFGGGDAGGVVVATFDGAPDAWVTEDLLTFSPATPAVEWAGDTTNQELTTTEAVYEDLSITVTVPEGKTFGVLAVAAVDFECTSYSDFNIDRLGVYFDDDLQGQWVGPRTNAKNERYTTTVPAVGEIEETTVVSAKVMKTYDRNTEIVRRGDLVVLYWEVTA